jgi:hypothetical protein
MLNIDKYVYSIKVVKIKGVVEKALESCNILDKTIINVNERSEIKSHFISGLFQAKIDNRDTSIQNIISSFLSNFGRVSISKDLFIVRVRASILLLR